MESRAEYVIRHPHTTTVADLLSDPTVELALVRKRERASESCAVANLYRDRSHLTLSEMRDHLLRLPPPVSLAVRKNIGDHIPLDLCEDLARHIASDPRCREKALLRIKTLTETEREILHGTR